MNEDLIYVGLRNGLVKTLIEIGIRDVGVLKAISKIPRQLFVPKGLEQKAYDNRPLAIWAEQTISQPVTLAIQTELLEVHPEDKILEIGTGSGYQAAVLAEMNAEVYTIERQRELYLKSKEILTRLKYRIAWQHWGDGYEGNETFAPFDKILITAAVPKIPVKLLQQLKTGGRMVAPVGAGNTQKMTVIDKISENRYESAYIDNKTFSFVPMLAGCDE
ncbi:MAG: protein-L-isoaspartate(D-aspartate) O-methyltransferase [Prevotellaceae bacterium]|jgi:protein-L-isoaspartate(D-aspartate) O-methyltransferase|nr:protein-L-isoaspartate(D-aspartate) O-methyltransferase [Prevotellaceae bacterium]